MQTSNSLQLVQIDPKVIWDSTEPQMVRIASDAQRCTIDRLLDSPLTLHVATKYDSRLAAVRVTCAEVRHGCTGRWTV